MADMQVKEIFFHYMVSDAVILRVEDNHSFPYGWHNHEYVMNGIYDGRFKIALRSLSDMTEEEKEQIGFKSYQMLRSEEGDIALPSKDKSCRWAARQTIYLLKQGFDLFGLIESGQAIDKTKMK